MVTNDHAHRQEAEDITSAVLEGVDAFCLCHETSVGSYPIESVT